MLVPVTDAMLETAEARIVAALARGNSGPGELVTGFVAYSGADVREQAVLGLVAELAVARAFHVELPDTVGPDGGFDLWLNGRSVQVKWNNYVTGDFYGRPDLPMRADYGVLVVPATPGSVRLRGVLTRGEYEEWAEAKSYGYNTVRAVSPHRLHPIETLLWPWLERPFAAPGYVSPPNLGSG